MNDAADVRLEIDDAAADALTNLPVAARSTSRRPAALIVAINCRCCDCRRVTWFFTRVSNKTPSPAYLSFSLPLPTQSVSDINADHRLAISPDGRKVVYEATVGDHQLYLRFLDEPEGKLIEGTTDSEKSVFLPTANGLLSARDSTCKKLLSAADRRSRSAR